MSPLITEKIDSLIALAKLEGEPNVQIVLLALSGARAMQHDGMLAGKVQEYLKDVLIPLIEASKNAKIAQNN